MITGFVKQNRELGFHDFSRTNYDKMVGDTGFEPVTSAVWRQRSPAELIAHNKLMQ